MYEYDRRRKIGPVTILFLFLFSASMVGLAVMSYLDRGRFWDMLPYFCIPIIVLSLIFAIYNLVRRCNAGFVFILFFIIFTIGLVLSSVYGPFALRSGAADSIEQGDYADAIEKYTAILEKYPSSRYAGEALHGISFAYYNNNQYYPALSSFNEAVEKDIIDPGQLEVMDILQDIYYNIALDEEEDGQYLEAANNYVRSIDILKQVRSGFPETNEAFIAQYKIPQYLLNASENFRKHGDIISQIRLLEELLQQYPESDQARDAMGSLGDAYMERAVELSASNQYEDAIEWFLKYLENNPRPEENAVFDYKIRKIFEGMPPFMIKRYADNSFKEQKYDMAAFLYQTLIDLNPDYYGNSVDGLVGSKIILAQSAPYNEILDQISGKYVNTPGLSMLILTNNTADQLTAYIMGPDSHIYTVPAGETVETGIVPGEYTVLVESSQERELPHMGTALFEEYRQYTIVFEDIMEEEAVS